MATQAFISDFELQKDSVSLSGRLDANGTLRLFKNAWVPTNNQVIGSFSEANFVGYAGVLLAGRSTGTVQLAIGVWELRFSTLYFNVLGGPTQFIHGWYITDSFNNVLVAQQLPAVKTTTTGMVIAVTVRVQTRALNIACP